MLFCAFQHLGRQSYLLALWLAVKLGLAIPAAAFLLVFVTVGRSALSHAWQPGHASPVIPVWFFAGPAFSVLGMDPEVVTPGHDVFACATPAAWEASPRQFLPNPALRATLGTATRRTIASSATPRPRIWQISLAPSTPQPRLAHEFKQVGRSK